MNHTTVAEELAAQDLEYSAGLVVIALRKLDATITERDETISRLQAEIDELKATIETLRKQHE